MNRGAAPSGVQGERQVSRWVRSMFDSVAPRYDLLNHLLSLNIDRYWRRRTVSILRPVLERPGVRALDLCCGSGDLLSALSRRAARPVLGADFSHEMLRAARRKIESRSLRASVVEADALQLPFRGESLDLVTAAFGFRNLAHYGKGLSELLRVLRRGGTAAILEFSTPPDAAIRAFYDFYANKVLPRIGAAISGDASAYSYLPESVKKFPTAEQLAAELALAGFSQVRFYRMTFGVVALHTGVKA